MYAALESSDLTKLGIGVIVGLVLIGFVLSMLITALVARLVIIAVVIGLGVLVWQQKTSVQDDLTKRACDLNTTFFGIHVDPPSDVTRYCTSRR